MEGSEVRIGVVIDDKVNRLHKAVSGKPNVALDDHWDDTAVFRDGRHVQLNVSPSNRSLPKKLLEDSSHLFVGNFGIARSQGPARGSE
jgi:hypothetical protein